jgi:hypothetical protein
MQQSIFTKAAHWNYNEHPYLGDIWANPAITTSRLIFIKELRWSLSFYQKKIVEARGFPSIGAKLKKMIKTQVKIRCLVPLFIANQLY